MFVLIPLGITIISCLFYYHLTRTLNYWKKRNIAGPKPVPFFGNILESAQRKTPVGLLYKKYYQDFPGEKVVGIYLMKTPAVLIRDLDIVKHVLIKDFDVFPDRGVRFGEKDLGTNLFHADGDIWRVLRNHFTPIFTSGKLKNMLYLIIERADRFIEHVEKITKLEPELEVHPLMQKYTQATIAACAFGLDIDTYDQHAEAVDRIDKKIFTVNSSSLLNMMYPGLLKTLGLSKFPSAVKDFFMDLTKKVIAQRDGKPSGRNDFMDLILSLREAQILGPKNGLRITKSLIAAQMFVFYAAGYETSASTMGFMLYQLALNPGIQDKVIAEVDEVMRKHGGVVSMGFLSELVYMSKVIAETLRMYPIIDKLKRCAQADYKVPGSELLIKKGQTIIVPVHGIHFDEAYYPHADVFDPERFSADHVAARHPCAYLPFGLGPRHCIGMRFAQVQSKVCLTKLLSRFRVEVTESTNTRWSFSPFRLVLYPEGGITLKFVRRS